MFLNWTLLTISLFNDNRFEHISCYGNMTSAPHCISQWYIKQLLYQRLVPGVESKMVLR